MEIFMNLSRAAKASGGFYEFYARFELAISAVILFFTSLVILHSTAVLALALLHEFSGGFHYVESAALKDAFGLILTVLILIEFNHSIVLSMRQRAGVLQVRVIVVIAVIVIARKLILFDYASANWPTLLGLGGLALALGALYWLMSDIDRRRRAAGLPPE
jgi:uncharacterized membrane protein (DUF373 family)